MSSTAQSSFERALALMTGARDIVAFTGAGISAESGIPTYRDCEDSLWNRYDPDTFANIDTFMRDSSLFWNFFRDVRYRVIRDAQPNPGHYALADLERSGRLRSVITQNIDGLHQAAGSRRVIELHGNTRFIRCLACGGRLTMDEVYALLQQRLPPPCPGCGGKLKPEVVFFGEALPAEAFASAAEWIGRCDLLLAIGSSLAVYPAALLPAEAKARGAGLIVVNRTPTPADGEADVVLHEAAGEVLPRLTRALGIAEESSRCR
ncbi:MAG: NAD-dependent deacylase [Candidatus Eisenbacteria bacterium]